MERSGVLPTTQFAYRKGLGTVMHFCACPIHCKVHWRVGRRLGSCRLISVQPLIGSTISESSISYSVQSYNWTISCTLLYVYLFEVLCCLH